MWYEDNIKLDLKEIWHEDSIKMGLKLWLLTFVALLSLELANKAVITPFEVTSIKKGKSQKNKIIFYSHLHLHSKRFVTSW
jgi:hypothetical protein